MSKGIYHAGPVHHPPCHQQPVPARAEDRRDRGLYSDCTDCTVQFRDRGLTEQKVGIIYIYICNYVYVCIHIYTISIIGLLEYIYIYTHQ